MIHIRFKMTRFISIVFILFFVSISCSLPILGSSDAPADQSIITAPEAEDEQTSPDAHTNPDEAAPDEEVAEPELAVSEDGTSLESGFSRRDPFPISTYVSTTYWDFQVLEFYRGEEAWQIILQDDSNNPPPPGGKEYALAKIWVFCKNTEPGSHDIDLDQLFITGDHLRKYTDKLWDSPQPEFFFSDIYTAEESEGWLDVLVDIDEGNLMLVFDRSEYVEFGGGWQHEVRYVALEEGASIEIPPDIASIQPNELGEKREKPAPFGATVITEDWEVTVLEVYRGEEASALILEADETNKDPDEGMEFIVLKIRIRYISETDIFSPWIGYNTFQVANPAEEEWGDYDSRDNKIKIQESKYSLWLFGAIFPGKELEGYIALMAPAGKTNVILNFSPFESENRFLSMIE
ncbi:MAG: DUF4352 domain-containing protein [Anaerolineaceae bacterium]|nr:DUF4352 domain-containing protein [Anaerolineaceae bacterium]